MQTPGKIVGLALAGLTLAALLSPAAFARQGQEAAMDPTVLGLKSFFTIEIKNPTPLTLENYPLVLKVKDIWQTVPDFQSYVHAIFEKVGDEYAYVRSQADDLDGDKYHDEIVIVKTLLPNSTTRLLCYYAPKGGITFQYPSKAYARLAWEPEQVNIGWESNLAAYRFYWGQLEAFGKVDDQLILRKLPADYHALQPWGMDILKIGEASGLGGISLWEGETRIPAMNPLGKGDVQIKRDVLAVGPLRSLAKVEMTNIKPAKADYKITLFMSAFADNAFSRQEIVIDAKPAGKVVYSPGLEKLEGETAFKDEKVGYLAVWGRGAQDAGEVGLAVIFDPKEYAGFAENALDRYVKLTVPAGEKRVHWIFGGWDRGVTAPPAPRAANWKLKIEDLAKRLLAPVKVVYKVG